MTEAPRLLVIEDDRALREAIAGALVASGHTVRAEANGRALDDVVSTFEPDLVIFDIRLSEGDDGFALAARLRTDTATPFIFVTAVDGLAERLRGFELGADDYLVKPFAMAELIARVGVALRRVGRTSDGPWRAGDLTFDDAARQVERDGVSIALTKVEYALLATLARTPGRVFSKHRLLSAVWGFDEYDPNVVEVHVSAVRRKLEQHGPRVVHTERGQGYVFR